MRVPLLGAVLALVFAFTPPAQTGGFSLTVICEDEDWDNYFDWVDTVYFWPSSLGEDYTNFIYDGTELIDVVFVSRNLNAPITWYPSTPTSGVLVSQSVGKAQNDDIDAICTLDCFAGDTPVSTPTGLRPIATLAAGDLVLSGSNTPVRVAAIVKTRARELMAITLESGVLQATPRHPFLTKRGWLASKDLCVGDALVDANGGSSRVDDVRAVELAAPCTVYQLVLDAGDSFAVGGAACLSAASTRRVANDSRKHAELWATLGSAMRSGVAATKETVVRLAIRVWPSAAHGSQESPHASRLPR